MLGCLLALGMASAAGERSFSIDTAKIPWQPVELAGVPKGMLQRPLLTNDANKTGAVLIRFPKGYRDPRHYHTTCSHSLYITKGKLQTPDGTLGPGAFLFSKVNERHGPLVALEETDMVIFLDGPLDYFVDEKK
jgi:quercetin dioxygenase-like cupin family protein